MATPNPLLVDAFRTRYIQLEQSVGACLGDEFGDSSVIARVGDDLDEYHMAFTRVSVGSGYIGYE